MGSDLVDNVNARRHPRVDGAVVAERPRLIEAMATIEGLLGARPDRQAPYLLRPPQPGDLGWVVHRHGAVCAQEHEWDEQFEAQAANVVAQFVHTFDPARERGWIAEKDGEVVGSAFLVNLSKTVAGLRLLLVEPKARRLGIGGRLVSECVRFARQARYRKVVLRTYSLPRAAHRVYERAGFRLVHEEPHHRFGRDLVEQTWELPLRPVTSQ